MYAAGPQVLVSTGEHEFRLRVNVWDLTLPSKAIDPALVLAGVNVALDGNGGASRQWWSPRPHLQPRARCPTDTDPGLTEVVAFVHEQTAMEPSPS